MHDETTLITGGTGFAGGHLVEALLEDNATQVHVTGFSGRESIVHHLLPADHIHQVDLTSREETLRLFEQLKPKQVYHLAAFADVGKSFEHSSQVMHNNTALQLNVLEAIKQYSPEARLLSVGSALQYGIVQPHETPVTETQPFRPVNPYAVSKVTQELLSLMYFHMHALKVVCARSFNHVGERQTTAFAVPAFAKQIVDIERGDQAELLVGNLDAKRDFADVKDVVRAYILLMQRGTVGDVYNVGSGVAISMQEVLDILIAKAVVPVEVKVDPQRLRPVDVPIMVADSTKLKELGWQPKYSVEETVERVLAWFRQE